MNLRVRPRAPNHPKNDALDTLRPCVEHNFSWNNKNMLKSKLLIKIVLHFTSRFTRQPSSGEGITLRGTEIEIFLGKQETYL